MDSMNGSMEHNRAGFPAGFLGLHPLMPGTSGMHSDNFGEWEIPPSLIIYYYCFLFGSVRHFGLINLWEGLGS